MAPTLEPTMHTDTAIAEYADAVRLQLRDLDGDTLHDLTGGLEADLTESLAERNALGAEPATLFGAPETYAQELRTAAGLPISTIIAGADPMNISADEISTPLSKKAARQIARERRRAYSAGNWTRALAPVTSTSAWSRTRSLSAELRPAWWLMRGWLVGTLLGTAFAAFDGGVRTGIPSFLPYTVGGFLLTLAVTAVSVQWGRGRWLPWRWLSGAAKALSVAALLAAIPLIVVSISESRINSAIPGPGNIGGNTWNTAWSQGYEAGRDSVRGPDATGVWIDGRQIRNLFAFDADGNPIDIVQLYDEQGRPIRTIPVSDESNPYFGLQDPSTGNFDRWDESVQGQPPTLRGHKATDGVARWNVFPLLEADDAIYWPDGAVIGQLRPDIEPRPAIWPFLRATATFHSIPGEYEVSADQPADDNEVE